MQRLLNIEIQIVKSRRRQTSDTDGVPASANGPYIVDAEMTAWASARNQLFCQIRPAEASRGAINLDCDCRYHHGRIVRFCTKRDRPIVTTIRHALVTLMTGPSAR